MEPQSSYVKQQGKWISYCLKAVVETLRPMSPPTSSKGTLSSSLPRKSIGGSSSMQGVIGELQKSLKVESRTLLYNFPHWKKARTSPAPQKSERSSSIDKNVAERTSLDRSSSIDKGPDSKIQRSGSTEKASDARIQRSGSTEVASKNQRSPSVELYKANPAIEKIVPKSDRSGSIDSRRDSKENIERSRFLFIYFFVDLNRSPSSDVERRDSIDIAEEITDMDSEEAEVAK